MTTYGAPNTVTGKAFVKHQRETTSTAMALPIVKEAELKSANATINIARLSGKQKGAMVLMEKTTGGTLCVAVAKGSLPKDPWEVVELTTKVTPAE